jgi:hypothetical protein
MTIEMAEAWIDRFDNRQGDEEPAKAAKAGKSKPAQKSKIGLPKVEPAG